MGASSEFTCVKGGCVVVLNVLDNVHQIERHFTLPGDLGSAEHEMQKRKTQVKCSIAVNRLFRRTQYPDQVLKQAALRSAGGQYDWDRLYWQDLNLPAEVYPQLRLGLSSQGVKQSMIGNKHNAVWSERDLLPGKDHLMTWLQVVVQPPKRAEYLLIIPVGTTRDESGLVERQVGGRVLTADWLKFDTLIGERI